jgi:hypothetical protein
MYTKEQKQIYNKKYAKINRAYFKERLQQWRKQFPWLSALYAIHHRVNNKNNSEYHRYGGRGIKCFLTNDEIKELWFRDKAFEMKIPTIDRINNDGNYELGNCRFLEKSKNQRPRKEIIQLDLNKNVIKTWINQTEAGISLNLNPQNISRAIKLSWRCGNYYWKWKE